VEGRRMSVSVGYYDDDFYGMLHVQRFENGTITMGNTKMCSTERKLRSKSKVASYFFPLFFVVAVMSPFSL